VAPAAEPCESGGALSTDENERFGLGDFALFTHVAEGHYDAALQAASTLEKEARAPKNPHTVVLASLDCALSAALLGKYPDGQKYAAEAWARSESEPLSGTGRKNLQRTILVAPMWTYALGKKAADAEKTLTLMERTLPISQRRKRAVDSGVGSWLAQLRAGDANGAEEQMAKCIASDDLCHFHLTRAQEKAGDKAAAEATRRAAVSQRTQDSFYLVLRQQLLKRTTTGSRPSDPVSHSVGPKDGSCTTARRIRHRRHCSAYGSGPTLFP
jgi:hypothetical protein